LAADVTTSHNLLVVQVLGGLVDLSERQGRKGRGAYRREQGDWLERFCTLAVSDGCGDRSIPHDTCQPDATACIVSAQHCYKPQPGVTTT
jgi:hypothetical protein